MREQQEKAGINRRKSGGKTASALHPGQLVVAPAAQ